MLWNKISCRVNQSNGRVQDGLQTVQQMARNASQHGIAVVDFAKDKWPNKGCQSLPRESATYARNLSQSDEIWANSCRDLAFHRGVDLDVIIQVPDRVSGSNRRAAYQNRHSRKRLKAPLRGAQKTSVFEGLSSSRLKVIQQYTSSTKDGTRLTRTEVAHGWQKP